MATDDRTRQKLVKFVDKKILDPVLKASEKKYSGSDQKLLDRLKKKTEAQKERYAGYKTAAEVRQRFQGDLSSAPAKRVHAQLKKLHLPSQPDFKDEFLALCEQLGVAKHPTGRKSRSKKSSGTSSDKKKTTSKKRSKPAKRK
jgi:hypothetical protein